MAVLAGTTRDPVAFLRQSEEELLVAHAVTRRVLELRARRGDDEEV